MATKLQPNRQVKALIAAFRHEVSTRGPRATVAIESVDKPTKNMMRRFTPADNRSPMGSIISNLDGKIVTLYTAQELIDYFLGVFPQL